MKCWIGTLGFIDVTCKREATVAVTMRVSESSQTFSLCEEHAETWLKGAIVAAKDNTPMSVTFELGAPALV